MYKKEHRVNHTPKYKCNRYVRHGKGSCTPHSINADDLKAIVLDDINRRIALSKEDKVFKRISENGILQCLQASRKRKYSLKSGITKAMKHV